MKGKYIDTREGGYRFRVTNILLNSLFINHQLDLVFVTKASKHEEEEERKKNNQQVRTHQYATEL